ncbi:tRNA uridine-5-carboxymethylaminomethyl(34) synthesis GTPase MnmE [Candidatus Nitronereus thalassa]|uniref:tRNA modification GTPase MnmE n=1 Tax=Candidatus Nitronereus thalassa TaxID=3020898 RepID=A0ABU3K928_9BACT|nr:tRNA uridine-5-carboxymethylaminomethyl(34) synthesis GTPase MnmE [Candidatus Nitronereus thalassa]MDT7042901.1 tRNA uridine-5-carboxymethylaminomethyl(34) synthesis GTPase MnmE [Candidatus Nitronereus thalassa]
METSGEDTICAIATPMGEGGVGIVRVSGDGAIALSSNVVRPRTLPSLEHLTSHRMYLCDVLADWGNESDAPSHVPLDEALVVVMKRPRSYTGEDVVEIQTHGGPLILRSTCDALIRGGARMAEPGEFTKRAFLNGRLDLIQAEAVLDTIQATTASSLRTAQVLLRGQLTKEVELLREELIRNLAHLEAGMDFVEEDISFIQNEELALVLQYTHSKLQELIDSFEEGRIVREGIKAAIIGRPNVGKSSLLNALLKTDRAIVSPTPGTTRDVIDEAVNVAGLHMRLLDTAGLRQTEDFIEEEGMRRTKQAVEEADLLLILVDGSVGVTEDDRALIQNYQNDRCLMIINKCDLSINISPKEISVLESWIEPRSPAADKKNTGMTKRIIQISAKTGDGLDELKKSIRSCFLKDNFEPGQAPMVTHLRHKTALTKARDSIQQAQASIKAEMDGECIALDMRGALDSLGEITGAISTEDILDRIFRDFCIGK